MDLSESILARSDQQNYDDYVGGAKLVTVSDVRGGSNEQPVEIHLAEFPGKPYKPSKTMRRVLVFAWGTDSSAYIGRRLKLYGDPDVRYGGKPVGGIKIEAMSNIDRAFTLALTETRGVKKAHTVEPLPDAPKAAPNPAKIIDAFAALNVTAEQLETRIGKTQDAWTADDIAQLAALGKSIKAGDTTTHEEFDQATEPQADGATS